MILRRNVSISTSLSFKYPQSQFGSTQSLWDRGLLLPSSSWKEHWGKKKVGEIQLVTNAHSLFFTVMDLFRGQLSWGHSLKLFNPKQYKAGRAAQAVGTEKLYPSYIPGASASFGARPGRWEHAAPLTSVWWSQPCPLHLCARIDLCL